ncbi:MAG: hypothetical protein H6631_12280 [Anaerolineaceae bacterium]|nr:hypothetical protein [Anaerolineaceae bacterium]
MGFLQRLFGGSASETRQDKSSGANQPPPGARMQTLATQLVVEPFSKINYWDLPDGGKRVRVYFLMEQQIEGAQTGMAIDGSGSMQGNFGYEALRQVREMTDQDRRAIQRMGLTSEQQILPALVKLGVFAIVPPGPNIVQEQVRKMTEYLTKFDADGGTTVIYWATGDGRQIELVGDLTGPQCAMSNFPGPKQFGSETHLLPAIKYFADRFSDAKWGIYVFITDGALNDLDAVKRYTVQLARDIARGKRNDLKFILIGVGDEIDESQMEELDDLKAERDLWDHKIAKDMKVLAEIFAEGVSEKVIIVPGDGLIKSANGSVIKDYRDTGLPALMWFDLPAGSQWFTLEVGGQVVTQPLAAGVQIPGTQPAPTPAPTSATVACLECRRPIAAGTQICPHCNTPQDRSQPESEPPTATDASREPLAQPTPSPAPSPPKLADKPIQLVANLSSLDFGPVSNWKSNLPTQEIRLHNSGGAAWNGTARSTLPWLEVNPTTLNCPAGGEVVLNVSLTPAGGRLKARVYNAPDALIIESEGQILEVGAQVDTR